LGKPEDALRVSKDAFVKDPKDELLCREMAYAYSHLKDFKQAVSQYQSCISLCGNTDSQMAEKSELAFNLSGVFKSMDNAANKELWMKNAELWAPKGSPVYKFFHPNEN
jgi:hypothetical protein